MKTKVDIRAVSKHYGEPGTPGAVHALDAVSLTIDEGQFVSLLGPSGCGKSTLLYIVGGFEEPTAGEVVVDGRVIRGPGSDRGMVFQDYALFPWRTVLENVTFGPQVGGVSRREREANAQEYLNLVGLGGFEHKYPHELSGGMRQRCALARSVANNPQVLLMDEPLAAIDALTRQSLQEEILKVCSAGPSRQRKTVLYVTHSIEEAVFLSTRIVLMTPRPGCVLKILDVPFGSDRSDATRLEPAYQKLCGDIWQVLKDHIGANNQREGGA